MHHQLPGRRSRAAQIGLLGLLIAVPAEAQRTNDESRLTVGIAAGWIGGIDLWQVDNEPIFTTVPDLHDTYALRRVLRSDVTLSGQMTYYRGEHLGYSAEFTYVGLGTDDACTLVQASGDAENAVACSALNGRERTASASSLNAGFTFRPWGRLSIQPYVKALAGLTIMPRSTIETTSDYNSPIDGSPTALHIFLDDTWKSFRPSGVLAIGFATAQSSGYQLRVEFRETWVGLRTVTGPSISEETVPPTKGVIRAFPSIMVGFDIVLEKSRGRRY